MLGNVFLVVYDRGYLRRRRFFLVTCASSLSTTKEVLLVKVGLVIYGEGSAW
jgi:hypothetical protein